MDILFFIGQALAIAAIGYVVAQVFAYADKDDDAIARPSAHGRMTALRASEGARMEEATVRLSFVPESACAAEDLTDQASEEPASLRKAA